jgi:hypothetical protein
VYTAPLELILYMKFTFNSNFKVLSRSPREPVVKLVTSRRLLWAGHVARIGRQITQNFSRDKIWETATYKTEKKLEDNISITLRKERCADGTRTKQV